MNDWTRKLLVRFGGSYSAVARTMARTSPGHRITNSFKG